MGDPLSIIPSAIACGQATGAAGKALAKARKVFDENYELCALMSEVSNIQSIAAGLAEEVRL